MTFSKERMDNGLSFLQKGIDIVGENALIYAAIAYVHFQLANIGVEQKNNINRAEEFAAKALSINPELAEAHLVLANINFNLYGNPHKAIFHFNLAYNNKPNDPEIMLWLSVLLYEIGKTDAAMSLVNKCFKIDPINPNNYFLKGAILFWQGLFTQSLNLILEVYNSIQQMG